MTILPNAADIPAGTSKGDLARQLYPDLVYDIELPQEWVKACAELGCDPRPCFVWGYPNGTIFGRPIPLTKEAERDLPDLPVEGPL